MTPAAALYRRWVVANGLAEAVGLGGTFPLGRWLGPLAFDRPSARAVLAGAAAAVALGALLEGVLVGWFQARALGPAVPGLSARRWVRATTIGAAVAWAVGMVPSTVLALTGAGEPGPGPGPVAEYGLAAVLGLATGPILGFAQARVLRAHTGRAWPWLGANALAWAAGMPLIFAGMSLVPWEGHWFAMAAGVVAVCGAAGLAVGAIHGWVLVRLVRPAGP